MHPSRFHLLLLFVFFLLCSTRVPFIATNNSIQHWCTPPPLSMRCLGIASDAPAGIFQAQNAFQMPPPLLFSLFMSFLWPKSLRAAFLISYLYFGWAEVDFIWIHLYINQKNMFVSQSTLLLEYEYTYLIFVIFGLQATALFRPEKVRQKCVTSLQI